MVFWWLNVRKYNVNEILHKTPDLAVFCEQYNGLSGLKKARNLLTKEDLLMSRSVLSPLLLPIREILDSNLGQMAGYHD
jgi:hypothetical protein